MPGGDRVRLLQPGRTRASSVSRAHPLRDWRLAWRPHVQVCTCVQVPPAALGPGTLAPVCPTTPGVDAVPHACGLWRSKGVRGDDRPSTYTVKACRCRTCPQHASGPGRCLVHPAPHGRPSFVGPMLANQGTMHVGKVRAYTLEVPPVQRRCGPIRLNRSRGPVGTVQIRCQNGRSASGSRDTAFGRIPAERRTGSSPN